MSVPGAASSSGRTSSTIAPGSGRQSHSTEASAGITLSEREPLNRVGAIVVENRGSTRSRSIGCSAEARRIRSSRSPPGPASSLSSASVSGSPRRVGVCSASRRTSVASSGTAFSPDQGTADGPAPPSAVTVARTAPFSPTSIVTTVRPPASSSRSAAPSLMA
jgi:hypothetical protein